MLTKLYTFKITLWRPGNYHEFTCWVVRATSLKRAISKFARQAALTSWGTHNVYVNSVSPNDGYVALYGTLDELNKKYGEGKI